MTNSENDAFVNDIMRATKNAVIATMKEKYGELSDKAHYLHEEDADNIIIAFCAAAAQLAIKFDKNEELFINVARGCFEDIYNSRDDSVSSLLN